MDFGSAPNGDQHAANLRAPFERRATTPPINATGVSAAGQFITHPNKTASITRPIGDLLIGAHANNEGRLFVPMVPGQVGSTRFETVEAAVNAGSKLTARTNAIQVWDPNYFVTV